MMNADGETASAKPAFRSAFRRQRCLALADGFYEWRREGKRRMTVRFFSSETEPLWLDRLTVAADTLQPLWLPAPPELLDAREVSPMVNNVRNDGPGCIAPAISPEEVRLFS